MAIKRLHYFDHQFLVQKDFTDEQNYHLEMRRRLNRRLYTFGIAEGLEVVKRDNKSVTVRPGMAIDGLGQEMIVEADQVVDLSQFSANTIVFITIAYQERESDPSDSHWRPWQHPHHRGTPHPGRHDYPAERRHGHSTGPLHIGQQRQRAGQYQRPPR